MWPRYMSLAEISLLYNQPFLETLGKTLTDGNKNDETPHSSSDKYTIFHALFEAMKEKDKKNKKK